MPGLEVRGVTVRYAGEGSRGGEGSPPPAAVSDVSLAVAPGEVVALLGPSGGGKSTLLRAIAGLEPLADGAVRWDGADLARVPPHRRGFGLMFQEGQLFAHLSVAGNVGYGLTAQRALRPSRSERAARVTELLELVGLPGYGGRAVTALSGGERQRVALARALAPHPRLLLLDEPLSALDRELRERLAGELAVLLRRSGAAAILVTHDEAEAAAIADRTLRIRDGRLT